MLIHCRSSVRLTPRTLSLPTLWRSRSSRSRSASSPSSKRSPRRVSTSNNSKCTLLPLSLSAKAVDRHEQSQLISLLCSIMSEVYLPDPSAALFNSGSKERKSEYRLLSAEHT